jgi:hypothetical protein
MPKNGIVGSCGSFMCSFFEVISTLLSLVARLIYIPHQQFLVLMEFLATHVHSTEVYISPVSLFVLSMISHISILDPWALLFFTEYLKSWGEGV